MKTLNECNAFRIIKHCEAKREDGTVVSFDRVVVNEKYYFVVVSGTDKNGDETMLVLRGDLE